MSYSIFANAILYIEKTLNCFILLFPEHFCFIQFLGAFLIGYILKDMLFPGDYTSLGVYFRKLISHS